MNFTPVGNGSSVEGFCLVKSAEVKKTAKGLNYLDMILTEQPFIAAVQLQINYLDYDDPGVQSKACYDVAVKHGKTVIVDGSGRRSRSE